MKWLDNINKEILHITLLIVFSLGLAARYIEKITNDNPVWNFYHLTWGGKVFIATFLIGGIIGIILYLKYSIRGNVFKFIVPPFFLTALYGYIRKVYLYDDGLILLLIGIAGVVLFETLSKIKFGGQAKKPIDQLNLYEEKEEELL